jgi:hypothetical protein
LDAATHAVVGLVVSWGIVGRRRGTQPDGHSGVAVRARGGVSGIDQAFKRFIPRISFFILSLSLVVPNDKILGEVNG